MPYFDELTYHITYCIQRNEIEALVECANHFIKKMEKDPGYYPKEFITAAKEAVENRNLNEIIILADANTPFYVHTAEALRHAICTTRDNENRFRLLCISYAALYTYHYHHYQESYYYLKLATEMYQVDGGSRENLLLFKTFCNSTEAIRNKRYDEDVKRIAEEKARWRKEEEQQKKLKAERAAQRLVEIKEKNERQHKKQLEASARRLEGLKEFGKLPLEKKLEIILVDEKRCPEYYGLDYEAISEEDLKSVRGDVLQQVVVSFPKVKDAKWRAFKKRVKGMLAEREHN